jgi:hypothetical protein
MQFLPNTKQPISITNASQLREIPVVYSDNHKEPKHSVGHTQSFSNGELRATYNNHCA